MFRIGWFHQKKVLQNPPKFIESFFPDERQNKCYFQKPTFGFGAHWLIDQGYKTGNDWLLLCRIARVHFLRIQVIHACLEHTKHAEMSIWMSGWNNFFDEPIFVFIFNKTLHLIYSSVYTRLELRDATHVYKKCYLLNSI